MIDNAPGPFNDGFGANVAPARRPGGTGLLREAAASG
jgi:hypothetical protein